MAKAKNGLHITKDELYNLIKEFCEDDNCIISEVLKAACNNHHHITFEKNGITDILNVTYNTYNTISIWGTNQLSKELEKFIKQNIKIPVIPKADFTIHLEYQFFSCIIEYLEEIDGVKKIEKGNNQYTYINEIGEKIDLTYFPTTCNMRFQGSKLRLFSEVKVLIETMTKQVLQVEEDGLSSADNRITEYIKNKMPNIHGKISNEIMCWVQDSVVNMLANKIEYNDYGIWTYSILKGIEVRIKEVLKLGNITINKGSFYYRNNCIFVDGSTTGTKVLNNCFINNYDNHSVNILNMLYNIYYKERNSTFHTVLLSSSRMLTKSEAILIVDKAMEELNNSYI